MATFLTRAFSLTPITPPPPPPPLLPGEFSPFTLSGSGDSVPGLTIPGDARAILEIAYAGAANFAVVSFGPGDDYLDLLVNEIGAYSGRRPVNFVIGQFDGPVRYLEITASGPWAINVLPLSQAHTGWAGSGDDVVAITPKSFNRPMTITHNGLSNFIVWSYSKTARLDLEVNEIGSYTGTVLLDAGASYLDIGADGSWTFTIG
jgi:hypothetical protein